VVKRHRRLFKKPLAIKYINIGVLAVTFTAIYAHMGEGLQTPKT
jgi:hypothetical protein